MWKILFREGDWHTFKVASTGGLFDKTANIQPAQPRFALLMTENVL
jgi:hypothetical protein